LFHLWPSLTAKNNFESRAEQHNCAYAHIFVELATWLHAVIFWVVWGQKGTNGASWRILEWHGFDLRFFILHCCFNVF